MTKRENESISESSDGGVASVPHASARAMTSHPQGLFPGRSKMQGNPDCWVRLLESVEWIRARKIALGHYLGSLPADCASKRGRLGETIGGLDSESGDRWVEWASWP